MSQKKCANCNQEKDIKDLCEWQMKGEITYECANRKLCKKTQYETPKKVIPKEKITEEKFKEKFGFDLSELKELPQRFRDASVHYYHPKTNEIYSLSFGLWIKQTDSYGKSLQKYIPKDEAIVTAEKKEEEELKRKVEEYINKASQKRSAS
jgi:hypothetical protein